MDQEQPGSGMSRRELLKMIGLTAGSAAMYQAMTSLGYAAESGYKGPIKLQGAPRGASVLILGAGLAGMVAALELRRAGYNVKILEFNARAGGRNWSLRVGDTYTELGGATQKCGFAEGLYFNPGPWRIPYHHHALLDYCKRLGVKLEPFQQLNHNAYLHSSKAFGGKPQRIREIKTDFQGHSAELLAKAVKKGQLDEQVTQEDRSSPPYARGARSTRITPMSRAIASRGCAATRATRAAGCRASRCPARSSGCPTSCTRGCGGGSPRLRSMSSRPRCSSRWAAWAGSARRSPGRWRA